MKKLIYIFFIICFCFIFYVQEIGMIYFMRKIGILGMVFVFNVFIDGEFVCWLNNKKFFVYEVFVGEYIIIVQFSGKSVKEKVEFIFVMVEFG